MALKTPISMLQELMVSRHEAIPEYTFESVGTLLNPQFACTVKASSISEVAEARNKKEAKQAAAANALKRLLNLENVIDLNKNGETPSIVTNNDKSLPSVPRPENYRAGVNYVGNLNEYIQCKRKILAVNYTERIVIGSDQFEVTCILDEQKTVGYARNKKEAKQIAAFNMLECLKSSKYSLKTLIKEEPKNDLSDAEAIKKFQELSPSSDIIQAKSLAEDVEAVESIEKKHYTLDEATAKLKELKLDYTMDTIQTDPCMVAVQIVDKSITAMGTADNKHDACVDAMNKVLNTLSAGTSFTD